MATPDEVLTFLSGRYRKRVRRDDKMKDIVAPASISNEAFVLAGILAARFRSSISGQFIAQSGRSAGQVCDETILRRTRPAAEERAAHVAAFVDGRLSSLRPESRLDDADDGEALRDMTAEVLEIDRFFRPSEE